MKLTKSKLKQIVKKELSQLLESDRYPSDEEPVDWLEDRRFERDDNTQGGAADEGPGLDRYETEQITNDDMKSLYNFAKSWGKDYEGPRKGTLTTDETHAFKALIVKLAKIVS